MKPGVVIGEDGQLSSRPFYRVRLTAPGVEQLRHELELRAQRPRAWFTLIATGDNPSRLRFKDDTTPEFELRAHPLYVRGDVFRISGTEGRSCNLSLSSLGAAELAQRLAEAASRMHEWLEIRIPSRRRALIEIVPDAEMREQQTASVDELLGESGAALSAQTLPAEDFSDWETDSDTGGPRK